MAEPSRPDGLPRPPASGTRTTRSPKWLLPLIAVGALVAGAAIGGAATSDANDTIDRLRAQNAELAHEASVISSIGDTRVETIEGLRNQLADTGNQDAALVERLTDRVDQLERELQEEKKKRQSTGDGVSSEGGNGGGSGGGGGSPGARSFGDGTHRIPNDIDPGTYRASGGKNCYWERLRNFNGDLNSIIANGIGSPHPIVTIESTDAGFSSQRCGTWDRV